PFTGDYLVTVGGKRVNAAKLSNGVLRVTVPPWIDSFDLKAIHDLESDKDDKARFKADLVVTDGVRIFSKPDIVFDYWAPTPEISNLADPGVDLGVHLPEATLIPKSVTVVQNQSSVKFTVSLSRPVPRLTGSQLKFTIEGDKDDKLVIDLLPQGSQRLAP